MVRRLWVYGLVGVVLPVVVVGNVGASSGVRKMVVKEAVRQGVDVGVVLGVAWVESNFGKFKVGDKRGSYGVMQVRLGTAKFVIEKIWRQSVKGVCDRVLIKRLISDDSFNIKVGVSYLKWLLERCGGDYRKAVMAYNRGLKGKSDNGKYVKKVFYYREIFRKRSLEKL